MVVSLRKIYTMCLIDARTNSLIIQLLDLLKRRLFDVPNCRRGSIPCVCTAMKPGRMAAAAMPRPLSALRICVADCFESRFGVVIVRVQFIEADVVEVLLIGL